MEQSPQNKNSGLLKIAALITMAVLCLGVCAIPFFGSASFIQSIFDFLDRPVSASVISLPTIAQRVQPLGQLTTYRMPFAKGGIEIVIQYGVANICRIGAFHVVQGAIEAGIDLENIDSADVQYDEATNTYTLLLPSPTITNCTIDPMATQQYHNFGITPACPADLDEMRRLASYVAIRDFHAAALELGILDDAKTQAQMVLRNFLGTLTNANVVIEFDESIGASSATECNPNPPGRWVFNEEKSSWQIPG